MGTWIEACKAGTWTAKNGKEVTLTRPDLDNIADGYNPKEREAPLVFGHPADTEPAYGWAEKFKRVGDILMAKVSGVPDAVKNIVNAGHYKKVSLALGADKKTVRHIGLLGAVPPAVSGLADVKFNDGDEGVIIEFSNPNKEEEMEKAELEKKLADEKAARKAAAAKAKAAEDRATAAEAQLSQSRRDTLEKSINARVDKLVGKKIKAADKPLIKKIALALGDSEEIELSEGGGKKGLDEHLFDFLNGLDDLGLTTEFSDPGQDGDDEGVSSVDMMDRV